MQLVQTPLWSPIPIRFNGIPYSIANIETNGAQFPE